MPQLQLKDIGGLMGVFPEALHPNGLILKVLRTGRASFRNRHDALLLEVQPTKEPDSEPVVVWASPNVAKLADKMVADCSLSISTYHRGDVVADILFGEQDWVAPTRRAYHKVPSIAKRVPADVQVLTIESVRPTKDRDGFERVVFRDTEGRFWRFHSWQHSHTFKLEPGYGINVQAWKAVDPNGATFEMPSSSANAP